MESAAAPESGAPWVARGGVVAGAGGGNAAGAVAVADGSTSWDGGTPANDPYREQAYNPLTSVRQSNPRISRWSDVPPDQGSAQDATAGSESQPSPAGLEPPFKKGRNESQGVRGQGSSNYADGSAAAHGAGSGYGEAPPGMAHGWSGTPTAGGVAAQNYGAAGLQTYGVRYGGSTYGQNAPTGSQSYGSQSLPSYNAPVSFAPGSAKATGALFYKTKLCTKFKAGACTFNERCNFAHGVEELRKPPSGWEDMVSAAGGGSTLMGAGAQPRKTKLCRYFLEGSCPYGDRCNFLHGNDEAQKTPGMESQGAAYAASGSFGSRGPTSVKPNYKTRLCAKWEKGEPCDFGDKCHFAHGPAELQMYTGVSAYPNGGPVSTDMQYPSVPPEMAAPLMYGDPSMVNAPSIPAPYGAPLNYAGSVPNPVGAPNLNQYPIAGTDGNPYASSYDGSNGASANYNYWGGAPGQTPAPTQGYVQGNPTAPWTTNYSASGGYVQSENETALSQYPQEQAAQQQQTAQFFNGGAVYNYQDPQQSSNPTYVQDDKQSKYPAEARNGDGGYYGNVYSEANYPSQQPDYSARYNMAEPWGGKM